MQSDKMYNITSCIQQQSSANQSNEITYESWVYHGLLDSTPYLHVTRWLCYHRGIVLLHGDHKFRAPSINTIIFRDWMLVRPWRFKERCFRLVLQQYRLFDPKKGGGILY